MTRYAPSQGGTTPFSDTNAKFALAPNTALTYTVPGDETYSYRAEFRFPSNASIWVGLNQTPSVPSAGTITPGVLYELNPPPHFVKGGDTITMISGATVSDAGITLYQLPA